MCTHVYSHAGNLANNYTVNVQYTNSIYTVYASYTCRTVVLYINGGREFLFSRHRRKDITLGRNLPKIPQVFFARACYARDIRNTHLGRGAP